MDIEENYNTEKNEIEKDNILKSENLEVAAKSFNKSFNIKGFSWGMGIAYILSVYILICTIVVGGEMMDSIPLYLILNAVLFIIFVVFFVYQLVNIGKAVKDENIKYCVDGSLFYKYTLIPSTLFFILSSIFIFLGGLGISLLTFIFPIAIVLAPFFLAAALILPPILLGISFTVSLPGFVLFISMIMITKRQKEMRLGKCVLHVLLQLIPVIGIIDLVYVTNKYWKRGKVLAIFTAAFACILVILGFVNKVIM